jgi:uncharacterized membrane protein
MLAGLLALAGCAKESEPGGPGAPPRVTGDRSGNGDRTADRRTNGRNEENTFKLQVPRTATDLKQGGRKDVDISIDRGEDFAQAVKLQFKAPRGLRVNPDNATIAGDTKKVKVTIEAEKDAPVGETNIEVIGVPESGKSVSVMMPVEVDKET